MHLLSSSETSCQHILTIDEQITCIKENYLILQLQEDSPAHHIQIQTLIHTNTRLKQYKDKSRKNTVSNKPSLYFLNKKRNIFIGLKKKKSHPHPSLQFPILLQIDSSYQFLTYLVRDFLCASLSILHNQHIFLYNRHIFPKTWFLLSERNWWLSHFHIYTNFILSLVTLIL